MKSTWGKRGPGTANFRIEMEDGLVEGKIKNKGVLETLGEKKGSARVTGRVTT